MNPTTPISLEQLANNQSWSITEKSELRENKDLNTLFSKIKSMYKDVDRNSLPKLPYLSPQDMTSRAIIYFEKENGDSIGIKKIENDVYVLENVSLKDLKDPEIIKKCTHHFKSAIKPHHFTSAFDVVSRNITYEINQK